MDKYENFIVNNMGETCVDSLSIGEIVGGDALSVLADDLFNAKLTYGHIQGSPALKSAIASLYDSEFLPEDIVVTNGAIGANYLVFYALVNPGDHILAVEPSYQQLASVPRMFGGEVEPWSLSFEDGYKPNLVWLEEKIVNNGTKLLIINNPNNPTGFVWDDATIGCIVDICQKHGVTLFCDEVYRPLFHEQDARVRSVVEFGYDKTISTGSMSKAYSLAGLRVGWIATKNKHFREQFYEKRDYNTISVLMVDDKLATAALQNRERILRRNHDICRDNLAVIEAFIENLKGLLEWVKPRGGSTCFIKINGAINTSRLAQEVAEKHGTLVVPGELFLRGGFVRVGFGNSTADIRRGFEVLLRWVEKNGQ